MYVQLCLAIPRMQNDMVIQGRRKMIKVRGLNGGCEPPLGGSRGMPRAKFFSLKHVFLHLGVRFGIELGPKKDSIFLCAIHLCAMRIKCGQMCIHLEIRILGGLSPLFLNVRGFKPCPHGSYGHVVIYPYHPR